MSSSLAINHFIPPSAGTRYGVVQDEPSLGTIWNMICCYFDGWSGGFQHVLLPLLSSHNTGLPRPALKPFHRFQTSLFPSHQYTFFPPKITHSFCRQRMPSLSHDICSVPYRTLPYHIQYPPWRVAELAASQIIACPGMAWFEDMSEGGRPHPPSGGFSLFLFLLCSKHRKYRRSRRPQHA
jgi:hypothetical protein